METTRPGSADHDFFHVRPLRVGQAGSGTLLDEKSSIFEKKIPGVFYRSIFSAAARQKMEMVKKIWGVKKNRV